MRQHGQKVLHRLRLPSKEKKATVTQAKTTLRDTFEEIPRYTLPFQLIPPPYYFFISS